MTLAQHRSKVINGDIARIPGKDQINKVQSRIVQIFFSEVLSKNIHITLQGTNISPPKMALLKMIFLSPRWDMLVPWRVLFHDKFQLFMQYKAPEGSGDFWWALLIWNWGLWHWKFWVRSTDQSTKAMLVSGMCLFWRTVGSNRSKDDWFYDTLLF